MASTVGEKDAGLCIVMVEGGQRLRVHEEVHVETMSVSVAQAEQQLVSAAARGSFVERPAHCCRAWRS